MTRLRRSAFILTAAVVAAMPFAQSTTAATFRPPGFGTSVVLSGSTLTILGHARRLEALPDRPLPLVVSLRPRHQAGLARLLHDLYNPASPQYHRFLSGAAFAHRFAPPREPVEAWLRSRGLDVVSGSANGLSLTVRTTVRGAERAFDTQLYRYKSGQDSFFANAGPVRVPASLSEEILAVSGLNDAAHWRPAGIAHWRRPHIVPRDSSGPLGWWPSDLAHIYDIQPFYDQGIDGRGQTLAMFEYADYSDANIAKYDQQFNISPGPIERVSVSDGHDSGAKLGGLDQGEAELDIEVGHAVAPKANLLVYEAPNNTAGTIALWNRLVSDNRARVISSSWGSAESMMDPDEMTATDTIMQEAAAQGQSVFVASGDQGAYDASKEKDATDEQKKALVVDFPSSDPWVTGVGGTMIGINSDGSIGSETAWSDTSTTPSGGGGGGLSTVFKRPSYQAGPGVDNKYSNGMRQVPDVAAEATSYAIYSVTTDKNSNTWSVVGGTSAAAPLWASYLTLVDEGEGRPLGFLNPTLYALGQKANLPQPAFHDITDGNNLFYPATPGWDFATGWGSFDAAGLFTDLQTIGGGVVAQVPMPAPLALREVRVAATDPTNPQDRQKTAKRGQKVFLVGSIRVIRLPKGPVQWQFRLASPKKTLINKSFTDSFTQKDVGQGEDEYLHLSIPKKAPRGTYSFSVVMTVEGQTQQAQTDFTIG